MQTVREFQNFNGPKNSDRRDAWCVRITAGNHHVSRITHHEVWDHYFPGTALTVISLISGLYAACQGSDTDERLAAYRRRFIDLVGDYYHTLSELMGNHYHGVEIVLGERGPEAGVLGAVAELFEAG